MRKILWTISLLFITGVCWSQRSAEVVSYSENEKGYVMNLILSEDVAKNANELLSEFKNNNNAGFEISVSNHQLSISAPMEIQSGKIYCSVFKHFGIETLISRNGDMVTELSIDSYLEKINN